MNPRRPLIVGAAAIALTGSSGDRTLGQSVPTKARTHSADLSGFGVEGTNPLQGWTVRGAAFTLQPVVGTTIPLGDARGVPKPTLGGDYWREIPLRLGIERSRWISSAFGTRPDGTFVVRGDRATGALLSPFVRLTTRYVSFRVGAVGPAQRLVVWVRSNDGAQPSRVRTLELRIGSDQMRRRLIDLTSFMGRHTQVQLRFVDASTSGHLNVDDIRFSDSRPSSAPLAAVWGFADLHTHPMIHQAFGGLRGIPTIWGRPGGALAAYTADPALIERDIPRCDGTLHGGGTIVAAHALKGIEQFGFVDFAFPLSILSAAIPTHSTSGPPAYENYPRFYSGAHEQMHITQIRRAYDGGLRLLTALATHNKALEFAMSAPGAQLTTDRQIIEGLVCGMRRLVAGNGSWMEIAYTPADAARIIRANKLAVVLGTEVDQLGDLGFPTAQEEVDWLYGLGIRQVTPIHAINNRIGGPAIFQDVYASQNDFQNRPVRALTAAGFNAFTLRPIPFGDWTAAWFDVVEGGCDQGPRAGQRGECVLYRLNHDEARAFLYQPFLNGPPVVPFAIDGMPNSAVPQYAYALSGTGGGPFTRLGVDGHLNALGLTDYGRDYVRALMRRGMLVDIEHMSDRAAADTFAEAAAWRSGTTYPVMSSHTNFRSQSLQQDGTTPISTVVFFPTPHLEFTPVPGTTTKDFLPREFERSTSQVAFIRRSGGMLGPMVGSDPIDVPPDQTAGVSGSSVVRNDCAASSKGFALQYLYAVQQMGGRGVGLATDMGAHPMTSPRFGPFACWVHATDRQREEQQFPTLYDRSQDEATRVRYGTAGGLTASTMASRTFDFNTDGLAHYGLLPDLLQDAKNVGVASRDLGPLFSSAQDYIDMWTKASRLTTAAATTPDPSVCATWSEPPFP